MNLLLLLFVQISENINRSKVITWIQDSKGIVAGYISAICNCQWYDNLHQMQLVYMAVISYDLSTTWFTCTVYKLFTIYRI